MRDVNYGWLLRYIHANVASFFFIFVYAHIGRGLYYGSYKAPRTLTWSVGVIMLVLMMGIAFLGYVLPYGQMSLWGATVITNMLSAVPWIGQDFVQFFTLSLVLMSLITLGVVNVRSLRGRKTRTDTEKESFKKVPISFLAMFVGLVDGDGYISVTRTAKGAISLTLVLSLEIAEAPLLYELQSMLNIGRVSVYPNVGQAKFIIGRVDLQEVFFPLMAYYQLFFLTDARRAQFNMAMHAIMNNITRYDDLPSEAPDYSPALPYTPTGYLLLPFFAAWFVGFVIAEGSFYMKASGDHYFSVRQRNHETLFAAFKLLLGTRVSIDRHGGYMKLGVSSVKDLSTVVRFFSFSGHPPLMGLKLASYQRWLRSLASSSRYSSIDLPSLD